MTEVIRMSNSKNSAAIFISKQIMGIWVASAFYVLNDEFNLKSFSDLDKEKAIKLAYNWYKNNIEANVNID